MNNTNEVFSVVVVLSSLHCVNISYKQLKLEICGMIINETAFHNRPNNNVIKLYN